MERTSGDFKRYGKATSRRNLSDDNFASTISLRYFWDSGWVIRMQQPGAYSSPIVWCCSRATSWWPLKFTCFASQVSRTLGTRSCSRAGKLQIARIFLPPSKVDAIHQRGLTAICLKPCLLDKRLAPCHVTRKNPLPQRLVHPETFPILKPREETGCDWVHRVGGQSRPLDFRMRENHNHLDGEVIMIKGGPKTPRFEECTASGWVLRKKMSRWERWKRRERMLGDLLEGLTDEGQGRIGGTLSMH